MMPSSSRRSRRNDQIYHLANTWCPHPYADQEETTIYIILRTHDALILTPIKKKRPDISSWQHMMPSSLRRSRRNDHIYHLDNTWCPNPYADQEETTRYIILTTRDALILTPIKKKRPDISPWQHVIPWSLRRSRRNDQLDNVKVILSPWQQMTCIILTDHLVVQPATSTILFFRTLQKYKRPESKLPYHISFVKL